MLPLSQPEGLDWPGVAAAYLADHDPAPAVRETIGALTDAGPLELTRALAPPEAEAGKQDSTDFLLFAIREALADHELTTEEIRDLRHLGRVFRIQEGELASNHPHVVAMLLCREVERVLEDRGVSPGEAIHKVRLQELFGLGYDEFMAMIAPEVERLEWRLLDLVDQRPEGAFGDEAAAVRDQLAALSLVRHSQHLRRPAEDRAGYLYVLANPSMPGMVKVGRTGKPPAHRAAELAGATGVPTPFQVVFETFVADQVAAEAYVHQRLEEQGARVASNREFFAVEPSVAIRLAIEAAHRS